MKIKTQFFTFYQNNSGGHFKCNKEKGITRYVIIEAVDASHASSRGEDIGLYFDGVANDIDCACCGDRWCEPSVGTDELIFYGEHPSKHKEKGKNYRFFEEDAFEIAVHYLDGRIEWYH
jgi:hypothetical protein